jgi:hypothetical protein
MNGTVPLGTNASTRLSPTGKLCHSEPSISLVAQQEQ